MNKLIIIPVCIIVSILVACSETANDRDKFLDHQAEEVDIKKIDNWDIELKNLSAQNVADIKDDLSQLNKIVDGMNLESVVLRDEIIHAKGDIEQINKVLIKSYEIQQKTIQDLKVLALNSSEVQNLRNKMIENLVIIQKMYEISKQPNFDIKKPTEEFKNLSLSSQVLQQTISKELDQLNIKFK